MASSESSAIGDSLSIKWKKGLDRQACADHVISQIRCHFYVAQISRAPQDLQHGEQHTLTFISMLYQDEGDPRVVDFRLSGL